VAITVIATGFPLAVSEMTGSTMSAGAAVKRAAQQVEDQATVLRRQLSKSAVKKEEEVEEDEDIPDFISRLRRKK
ncbi:hypothetical protein B484DRAFT_389250, partial [Ochromonadaceae sp. CCMP2298]